MSPAEWAGLIITAGINLGIGVYVYGRLTERVKNHGDTLTELKADSKDHGIRIIRIEEHLDLPPRTH